MQYELDLDHGCSSGIPMVADVTQSLNLIRVYQVSEVKRAAADVSVAVAAVAVVAAVVSGGLFAGCWRCRRCYHEPSLLHVTWWEKGP